MPRRPRDVIERRDYTMPPEFPIVVLTGEAWQITDIRSPSLHFHNYLEIGMCHSGSGTLEFWDTSYHFKMGDVTLIPRCVPHNIYSDPGITSEWSWLIIDLEMIVAPLATALKLQAEFMRKDLLNKSSLVIGEKEDPMLSILVNTIIYEVQNQKANYKSCVRGLLDALLSKLARYQTETGSRESENMFPVAPALMYIHRHYMEIFQIDDLARLCKMSTSYFRRVFAETMGVSPLEYVNQTRITRACALLQITNYSILEICEEVGFQSLSSFNRHFSRIIGQSPTAWRHHNLAERSFTSHQHPGWMVSPQVQYIKSAPGNSI